MFVSHASAVPCTKAGVTCCALRNALIACSSLRIHFYSYFFAIGCLDDWCAFTDLYHTIPSKTPQCSTLVQTSAIPFHPIHRNAALRYRPLPYHSIPYIATQHFGTDLYHTIPYHEGACVQQRIPERRVRTLTQNLIIKIFACGGRKKKMKLNANPTRIRPKPRFSQPAPRPKRAFLTCTRPIIRLSSPGTRPKTGFSHPHLAHNRHSSPAPGP